LTQYCAIVLGVSVFKLKPFKAKKIWGYENWLVSTHEAGESMIETPEANCTLTLKNAIGGAYPLIVKVIQADETLSVQVHPNDEYAARENSLGKEECWFVLDAKQNVELVAGIKTGLSKEDVREAFAAGRFESVLNRTRVERGGFLYIPAGLCHAIGSGIRLLEVQQSSDITYRFYDWGRGRELHLEKAFDVLETSAARFVANFAGRFVSPHFSLERLEIPPQGALTHNGTTRGGNELICESGTVLFVLEGNGVIEQIKTSGSGANSSVSVTLEDAVFFLQDEIVTARGAMSLMKINPR
jgi:mannose-6-phosphate isomerase